MKVTDHREGRRAYRFEGSDVYHAELERSSNGKTWVVLLAAMYRRTA